MSQNQGTWYIRKKGQVSGPFSSAVITNHLTVGRLAMTDEVSTDEVTWALIQKVPTLHPSEAKDELDQAKRRLDERTGRDRRDKQEATQAQRDQRKGERRSPESKNSSEHRALRQLLMEKYLHRHDRLFWPLVVTFIVLISVFILAIYYPTTLPIAMPNCSTDPGPAINWENCLKPQQVLNNEDLTAAKLRNSQLLGSQMMNVVLKDADLAYADIRFVNLSYSNLLHANLIGANLTQSDLSYADLSGANLSFANLTDTNLGQANLTGTRFDNAIWINGEQCAKGSIGECRIVPARSEQ